tara:strand:- start:156 stop:593 length:438 start_codon:yes stop_codon:yes gene_type:complete
MKQIYKLIILFTFTIVSAQTIINENNTFETIPEFNNLQHSIQKPLKFKMNHEFSLMTSTSDGISKSSGIYSNFTNYKFSKNMQLNAAFHLIQGNSNSSYSVNHRNSIAYEVGFEYKLKSNSSIILQISNYNTPKYYINNPLFNVP